MGVGLDAAGKTTIFNNLTHAEDLTTIPTIGFHVDKIVYKNVRFTMWDVGGQDKIRQLWHHYFKSTQGIIFVVDSSDCDRIEEVRDELHRLLNEAELSNSALLVFANKQDLPHAMSTEELTTKLGLDGLHNRRWIMQGTCATTGDGLYEGLEWFSENINDTATT